MNRIKYLAVLIAAIFLINLITSCGSISPLVISAASNDSSKAERTEGYLTTEDGRLLRYAVLLPQSWKDKIEIRKEGNVAYLDYLASPKQTLCSIQALTAEQWQQVQQEPGHGEELLTQDEIVYVYHIALDNPYTGSQAEEFQQMAGQVRNILDSLTVSIVTDSTGMIEAGKTLINFFYMLSVGSYEDATNFYGGSYENLIEMNPDIDPNDQVALLKNACTINGFQCLPVLQVVGGRQEWPDTFVITLEFSNPDGSLFTLGPCCGESDANEKLQSQFDFTVMRVPQLGNILLVQDLPVYVP